MATTSTTSEYPGSRLELKFFSESKRFETNGLHTTTSEMQIGCEQECAECRLTSAQDITSPILYREKHLKYAIQGLGPLKWWMKSLDASRTWLCYWNLHSLEMLTLGQCQRSLTKAQVTSITDFLGKRCQYNYSQNINKNTTDTNNSDIAETENEEVYRVGGFGGGPQQLPHCASTYAAVNALITLGTEEAVMERTDTGKKQKKRNQSQASKKGIMFTDFGTDAGNSGSSGRNGRGRGGSRGGRGGRGRGRGRGGSRDGGRGRGRGREGGRGRGGSRGGRGGRGGFRGERRSNRGGRSGGNANMNSAMDFPSLS
eukprot:g131.t1